LSKRVGIDLGTTFSAVAYINEKTGKPEVIKNGFGNPITPSVLCFQQNGNVLFGEDAKEMQATGDTNSIAFFKRNMGNDAFEVEYFGKTYTATDLSAILLKNLVKEAENGIGEKIDSAVITVPAYFTHKEREATIEAGKKAGLNVLAIINEPTAAAFAYGLTEKSGEQTVMIYDLGGGTFDVTIAKINSDEIEILGSDGNHELGGKDWDDCIARYLVNEFNDKYGIDLSEDPDMMNYLLVTAENVKKQLTSRDVVNVPLNYQGTRGTIEFTEEKFEEISSSLLGATKDLTEDLLSSIGLSWGDITGTILVGGSTRMRMVHNYVRDITGKEPLSGVNVDEAVALGAAIRANIDDSGQTISGSLGGSKRSNGGFKIAGAKAVSDVTAHAMGMIAVSEDGEKYINSVIIPKNTKIPSERTKSYNFRTRQKDNELEIYVLQGANERPLDNNIINKYVVTNIQPVQSNPSVIDVSYSYTSNGVIEVAAVQKETGQKLPIRIEPVPDDMSWTDGSPKDMMPAIPDIDIMLAIDLSGSMSGEPVRKAKEAMLNFVNQMDSSYTKIGLMAFADRTKVVLNPTDNYDTVAQEINFLDTDLVGICNAAQPFTDARRVLTKKQKKGDNSHEYIIVLTDGCWNCDNEAIAEAKICHKTGIDVIALGFGTADYKFLKKIASMDDFASLTNLSDLSGSFSKIAQTIGDSVGGSGIRL